MLSGWLSMAGAWLGASTLKGLLRPLCPAPSSARRSRLVASEAIETLPVQTPCVKLPETAGETATVLDDPVEPLNATVPIKLVTTPLAMSRAWMVTANGTLVICGDGIWFQAK